MPEHHHRSRSGSPSRHESKRRRHRSRSPHQRQSAAPKKALVLPLGACEISRHDLPSYRPLFALYLDIQKQLDIEELDETEVKGRWKSFVGRWNRGELAEGWYDRKTLERAVTSEQDEPKPKPQPKPKPPKESANIQPADEDDFGPALPSSLSSAAWRDDDGPSPGPSQRHGASIPSLQDLRARDEQAEEDAALARENDREDLRHERRADRKLQKERLDEVVPRAEAGTRERQLEKKREKANSNRAFAASKDAGDADIPDADVMGDQDSLSDLKRMQTENERRKNERELRKEEVLRARRAERDARLAGMKEKEDRTMAMFKEIAKARFGGGEGES